MTLASSRGAFGATAIAAVQVISLIGEEDDEDTMMVLSIRGRERERDFLRVDKVRIKERRDKYASRKMAFFG